MANLKSFWSLPPMQAALHICMLRTYFLVGGVLYRLQGLYKFLGLGHSAALGRPLLCHWRLLGSFCLLPSGLCHHRHLPLQADQPYMSVTGAQLG